MFLISLANTLMHKPRVGQQGHSADKRKGKTTPRASWLPMQLSHRAPSARSSPSKLLPFGIAIGTLIGLKLASKKHHTSPEMPRTQLWRTALAEKYGAIVAEVTLANMQAHFCQLMLRRPHFNHPALRSHFERGIAPGMALYQTLREQGGNSTAALNDITELIASVARRSGRQQQLQFLKHLPNSFGVFRLFTQLVMRQTYPAVGWDIQWLENSDNCVAFNISRCFYQEVLKAYGMPELTPAFCKGDDELFRALPPGITWERTGTLAQGNPVCDFCWRNRIDQVAEGPQS